MCLVLCGLWSLVNEGDKCRLEYINSVRFFKIWWIAFGPFSLTEVASLMWPLWTLVTWNWHEHFTQKSNWGHWFIAEGWALSPKVTHAPSLLPSQSRPSPSLTKPYSGRLEGTSRASQHCPAGGPGPAARTCTKMLFFWFVSEHSNLRQDSGDHPHLSEGFLPSLPHRGRLWTRGSCPDNSFGLSSESVRRWSDKCLSWQRPFCGHVAALGPSRLPSHLAHLTTGVKNAITLPRSP